MTGPLASSLITKLAVGNHLDGEDIRALLDLPIRSQRLEAHHPIVREGDRPAECCLLADGFAFRSKNTFDGQRQIISLHIPGEIPDLQSLHLHVMDHDLTAFTSCTLGFIAHSADEGIECRDLRSVQTETVRALADMAREDVKREATEAAMVTAAHLMSINVREENGPVMQVRLMFEIHER
jgi:hypothetical protein